jgi:hypothetical protein
LLTCALSHAPKPLNPKLPCASSASRNASACCGLPLHPVRCSRLLKRIFCPLSPAAYVPAPLSPPRPCGSRSAAVQDHKEQMRAQMYSRNDPNAPEPAAEKEEKKAQACVPWGPARR